MNIFKAMLNTSQITWAPFGATFKIYWAL